VKKATISSRSCGKTGRMTTAFAIGPVHPRQSAPQIAIDLVVIASRPISSQYRARGRAMSEQAPVAIVRRPSALTVPYVLLAIGPARHPPLPSIKLRRRFRHSVSCGQIR